MSINRRFSVSISVSVFVFAPVFISPPITHVVYLSSYFFTLSQMGMFYLAALCEFLGFLPLFFLSEREKIDGLGFYRWCFRDYWSWIFVFLFSNSVIGEWMQLKNPRLMDGSITCWLLNFLFLTCKGKTPFSPILKNFLKGENLSFSCWKMGILFKTMLILL